MTLGHRCDVCNNAIADKPVTVGVAYPSQFELCANCAKPIVAALRKLKLTT